MFRHIRYQTGEIDDLKRELSKGEIPCVDVDDNDELNWFIKELSKHGIYKVEGLPYDKDARDRVKEPEFEFRIAFSDKPDATIDSDKNSLMYIDFYFEPFEEKTYAPIFGD